MKNKFNIPLIINYQGYILIENFIEHYYSSIYKKLYKDRTVNNLNFGIELKIYEK